MRQVRVAVLLPLAVVLTLSMVSIARAQRPPMPNMVLQAEGETLGRLEVQLRFDGMKEPFRYELNAENGAIVGAIALPKEGGAQYDIVAYDGEGNATHIGNGPIGNFRNPTTESFCRSSRSVAAKESRSS